MRTSKRSQTDLPVTSAIGPIARLPYAIVLWNLPRTAPERVLGKAANLVIARTVFTAAQTEHVGRLLVLQKGAKIIQRSL
jgi:hypothetical protein